VTKVTQARIREETERREEAARKAAGKPEQQTHLSKPLEENINRLGGFLGCFFPLSGSYGTLMQCSGCTCFCAFQIH
jgi:hypothetical protein